MILSLRLNRKKRRPVFLIAFAFLAAMSIFYLRSRLVDTSAQTKKTFTLVIDAGHGGIDGGAVGADGTKESDVNLSIALKLRALAELYGLDNTMVRQADQSLSSGERYSEHNDLVCRTQIVNTAINPILISIHQNCYPTGQPSGAQVLYSASEGSEALGKLMQSNLISALDPSSRRVPEPASKKLYIFSNVTCPAVLVECGFMSNFSDLVKLTDEKGQTAISTVLIATYLQYLDQINYTHT